MVSQLRGIPLGKLDAMTAESVVVSVKAGRQRQLVYSVLHRALGAAVEKGLLAANPMQRVTRPKYRSPEARSLTPEECRRLFETVRGHRLEVIFWLAATAGLRYGELAGLQRQDIGSGVVAVRRAISETGGEVQVIEPKSKTSRRTVSLSPGCKAILDQHLDRVPGPPKAWVFTNNSGAISPAISISGPWEGRF